MSILQVVLSVDEPDEAKFHDGNFDRWDVDQEFFVGCRLHHAYALWLEKKHRRLPTCQECIQVPTVVCGPVALAR